MPRSMSRTGPQPCAALAPRRWLLRPTPRRPAAGPGGARHRGHWRGGAGGGRAGLERAEGQPDAAQARLERAWQRTQDSRDAARRAGLLMALDRSQEARAWPDSTRSPPPDDAALLLADAD